MSKVDSERLELVYSLAFSSEEISEINAVFSGILPVAERHLIHESVELMPAILTISLGVLSGIIATGFFRAIGSDIYEQVKKVLKRILPKKGKPTIVFEMEYKSTKISITSQTSDEREIEKIFDAIEKARDIAVKSIDNAKTPRLTELVVIYDNGWEINSGQYWNPPENVAFYSYNSAKKIWELSGSWGIKNGEYYQRKKH